LRNARLQALRRSSLTAIQHERDGCMVLDYSAQHQQLS
jgi:hypothetical protein